MSYREISMKDEAGNIFKLSIAVDPRKTNRYQFSFFLNEKEFSLSKLQSKTLADMTWELVERILKKEAPAPKENKDENSKIPSGLQKMAKKVSAQSDHLPQRPKKREKK